MPVLDEEQKAFIVQQLACWRTPSQVVEDVKEEWPEIGSELDRRQVQTYDATRSGQKPGKKWVALFHATREAFENETAKLGICNRLYRMNELWDLYRKARRMKNLVLAGQFLEQAAKEVGGMYTNKRVLSGALGVVDLSQATDAQLDAILAGADPEEILESGQQRD